MISALFLSLVVAQTSPLEQGRAALDAFQPADAVRHFEEAQRGGPWTHAQLVTLYEGLGTALAYLGQQDEALAAFTRLIDLEPQHVLPYTLSPRVTFIFERARRAANLRLAPALELHWPLEALADNPLDLDVGLSGKAVDVSTVAVHYKLKGAPAYQVLSSPLVDGFARIQLPALDPTGQLTRELFVVGLDTRGNELLVLASALTPRELTLKPDTTPRWYQRWWVWAIAGVAVVGASVTTVYFATRPAPATVPATFRSTTD